MSDNEIYLLIKHIKSVLWRVAKCLSYIEDTRCLKVNIKYMFVPYTSLTFFPLVYIIHSILKIRNLEVQGNTKD